MAYAVMGGACVDLRRDDLPAEVRVRAVAVMGGVEVLVPPGVAVELNGLSLMGGRGADVHQPRPGAPVVRVDAYAVMGGVAIGHGDDRRNRSAGTPASPPAAPLPPVAVPPSPAGQGSVQVARRRRRPGVVKAVLLGALVFGGAQVAQTDQAAVFGSTHVQTATDVDVGVLFGGATVVVPDGARVRSGGAMIFGSADCRACSATGSGPEVAVTARGAFGGIEIVTRSQYAEQQVERPPWVQRR